MRRGWLAREFRRLFLCGNVFLLGCQGETTAPEKSVPSFPGIALEVAAIGDAAILAGVTPLRGEWEASRGGSVTVRPEPVGPESINSADVLVFPGERLGELIDRQALAVVPNALVLPPKPSESDPDSQTGPEPAGSAESSEDAFRYMDIAPAFRDQVSRFGSDRFGLPCGGSALVLIYHRTAFEREPNRAAAGQAGLELKPPALWTELDGLAKFFQGRDWNGDGAPDFGIALALGADQAGDGVGDATYLARAASLGQHRDHYSFLFDAESMSPRIDSPPFVEALRALVALKSSGPPGMDKFDGPAARAAFRAGKVAMLIDRAERASTWSHGPPIGVAPLPGSERVFEPARKEWVKASPPNAPSYLPAGGGWLVGVHRGLAGARLEAALDFAKYLANPENSNRIRSEPSFPMLPVRIDQMAQGLPDPTSAPDVDVRLWSDAVRRTLLAERILPGLRIPGAGDYLTDLGRARAAAAGGEDPEKALQQVARSWADRTARLGPKRQRWHYQRSLNSLATLPQPPEPGK